MTTTELAKREDDAFSTALMSQRADFQNALGDALQAEKFLADALTAIEANPRLRSATPESLLGALYLAAQLGLPVGGPLQQFHLTLRSVYNYDRKQKESVVVPIIGYPGLIKLGMNSGEYDTIGGIEVYANDEFDKPWSDHTGKHFKHRAADGDRGELIGVIGYATVRGSQRSEIEWIPAEVVRENHRPQQWEKTPWKTHEAQMFKKTGARVVSKYTAKSTAQEKFALAMFADSAIVRKIDGQEQLAIEHADLPSEDWAGLIAKTDDKADLSALYHRIGQAGELTDELTAQVTAHASTLTKDSRETTRDESAVAEAARAAVSA